MRPGGPQLRRTGALALARALAASLWVEPVVAQAEPEGDGFVRVRDGRFEGRRAAGLRELDHLASLGVDNLRVMAATEGPADQPGASTPPSRMRPRSTTRVLLHPPPAC